ncbi:glutamate-cysteine ligase family protein [Streptomyces sp. NBC_01367]|uniref:glutamate-cysteine ligase family protein n=1 Tax=Streptomyces sp. NBC_01367 TaxID=2903841 RepID=UPI003867177A
MEQFVQRAVPGAGEQGDWLSDGGVHIVTAALDEPVGVTPGERYERMAARWPALAGGYDGMVCGCHIHVGVTGHAQALALANCPQQHPAGPPDDLLARPAVRARTDTGDPRLRRERRP